MKIAQHSTAIINKREKKILNAFFTFQMGTKLPLEHSYTKNKVNKLYPNAYINELFNQKNVERPMLSCRI